jgi:hypothetical protein
MALREGPGMGHGAQGRAGDGSWRSGKGWGWVLALGTDQEWVAGSVLMA